MRFLNFTRFCLGCSASLFQVLVRQLSQPHVLHNWVAMHYALGRTVERPPLRRPAMWACVAHCPSSRSLAGPLGPVNH